jgi:hypothetical protein
VRTGIRNMAQRSRELGRELLSFLQPNPQIDRVWLIANSEARKSEVTRNSQSVKNMGNRQRNPQKMCRVQSNLSKRLTRS